MLPLHDSDELLIIHRLDQMVIEPGLARAALGRLLAVAADRDDRHVGEAYAVRVTPGSLPGVVLVVAMISPALTAERVTSPSVPVPASQGCPTSPYPSG